MWNISSLQGNELSKQKKTWMNFKCAIANELLAGAEALLKEGEVQAGTGRDADFAMRASEGRVKKAGPLPRWSN